MASAFTILPLSPLIRTFFSTNMLQDQYRESSKIENEYKKLLKAWEVELSSNPSTDIKKSKISKSEHIQFTLMHLFNGYLDQIWTDSQNMLQCAQAWTSQGEEPYPSNAIFTMNILGLHLMKQSLRTRQEFFKIVDELNGISSIGNENESLLSSSDSTISQDYLLTQSSDIHQYVDLEKCDYEKLNYGQPHFSYCDSSESPLLEKNNSDDPSSQSLFSSNRPFRLTSSPSTPTIAKHWSDESQCTQSFSPVCNYDVYYPKNEGVDSNHILSCRFCSEPLPIQRSLSADNLQPHQHSTAYSTEVDDDERDDCSSFEIASFYYNSGSDDEVDIMERELLLKKPANIMREKYQLPLSTTTSTSIGSSKIEIPTIADNNSTSSSIIHYDIETKEIKKIKIKRNRRMIRKRLETTSTNSSQSTYSPMSTNSSNDTDVTSIDAEERVKTDVVSDNNTKSSTKSLSINKIAFFIKKISKVGNEAEIKSKGSNINLHKISDSSKRNMLNFHNLFSSSRKK